MATIGVAVSTLANIAAFIISAAGFGQLFKFCVDSARISQEIFTLFMHNRVILHIYT